VNTFITTPGRRAARKLDTRGRLIAEARRLFAARGYEATTIRDLAAATGVAVGTVFVHFPDKGALLAGTLAEHLDQALGRALATLPPGGARRRIRHVVGALFRSYARHPALSRVLVKEALFAEGEPRKAAQRDVEAFVGRLAEWCAEPGSLRPGLDPGDAAHAVFAAYLAALVEGLANQRPRPERMVARVEQLVAPWFTVKDGGTR
jgi:AcrR family transcriptional regulator